MYKTFLKIAAASTISAGLFYDMGMLGTACSLVTVGFFALIAGAIAANER